jgi:NAD(P)-dependent dehydrogenase (short-subunit alcohol dehydrogenase family)
MDAPALALPLAGRTVLVTGASGAIGTAVARACAEAGAAVVLSSRSEERLRALAVPGSRLLAADLASAEGIAALVSGCPGLDGWVHCAGIAHQRPVRLEARESLRSLLALNLEAPLALAQALWKEGRLRPGASVVLVSSVAAHVGSAAHASYAASKAGLVAWVRSAALEGRRSRLRFNCLSPGLVRSPMADAAAASLSEEAITDHAQDYPLGLGTPQQVAGPAVFLLSEAASWVTGTTLIVDGGYSCH